MKTMILLDKSKYEEVETHLNVLYGVSHDIRKLTKNQEMLEIGLQIRRAHDRIEEIFLKNKDLFKEFKHDK